MGAESPNRVGAQSGAVFISYASQDAEAAQKICDALRAAGLEVWFDQSELRGGDVWDQKIRREIHDCALFIPVISANTASRREGYFRLEWDRADQRSHRMARDQPFIVPVCVDGTPGAGTDVPESFHRVQWTRLSGGETPPAFVARVAGLISGETPSAVSGISAPVRIKAPPSQRPDGRTVWIALGFAALAIAIGGGWLLWKQFASGVARAQSADASKTDERAKSIAVLPFVDMSEKHDQEYFADGMAEEVIDLLANIPGLKTISRTSSFQFKGKNLDVRAVGSALGASYLVEGSVRRSGDRIRVTVQLINSQDGSHLWSETYEKPVTDTFKVQDQIALSLARALQVTMGADSIQGRPTFKSIEAYDLYLRGRRAADRLDKQGLEAAEAYFQQVLELDPASVPAAEGLAWAQENSGEIGDVAGLERARLSAQHALSLDPNSIVAHVVLSNVHLIYDWDWAAAEREAKRALRLNPGNSAALSALGQVYYAFGRWDESARCLKAALTRDPLFSGSLAILANVRYATGRLSEAEDANREILAIDPNFGGAHFMLGYVSLARGEFAAALEEMQQEQQDNPSREAGLSMVYYAMGRRAESDSALSRLIQQHAQDDATDIAQTYAYRQQLDEAYSWLGRAYRQKDTGLYAVKTLGSDPLLRNFAHDPRYSAFLRKMNLPE